MWRGFGRMNIWHTTFLNNFNLKLYKGVLSHTDIISEEVSKKFHDNQYYGFVLQKENVNLKIKEKFFLPTDKIGKLPLQVNAKQKFSHKGEVFWFIYKADTIQMPTKRYFDIRELANTFANYKHSEQRYWTFAKIVNLAGYFEQLNIRIVSEASFGKDGIVDILALLNGNVVNLYGATLAKLKYSLLNDFIIINELSALTRQQISDMQLYLTQAGAYKPTFENNSRASQGTKETFDLTNKTHVIFHNTPDYYINKNQPYFDQMFTPAISDRFPALLMKGYVEEDFSDSPMEKDISEDDITLLKKVISTINYYKKNPISKMKYPLDIGLFKFQGKEKQRTSRSFKIICKYLAEYSESEDEFKEWGLFLKDSWNNYRIMEANSRKNGYK